MKIKKFAAVCVAGALIVSALTGCGINKNETIATMGDQEISLGVANFMCRYQQASSDDTFRGYFGDEVWSSDLYGSGSSMQETVKAQVMSSLHEMYTLQNHMEDYGVSLSDEEKQTIQDTAAAFMEANSKEALDEMGATQEIVEEVLTLYTIQAKMHEAIIADADTEVSDEEANMRAYSMISIATDSYIDDSYKQVNYTEEEAAEIKADAEQMAEALKENPNMEEVAEEYGYSVTTGTYDADDSKLDENVKTALDGLKEGEISDLITTDTKLYIVRIDSETDADATEKNRQSIIEERQSTLYSEVLAGWQEDDGWTVKDKVLAKIVFSNRFTQVEETETEDATE